MENYFEFIATLAIIAGTVVTSLIAFSNERVMDDLIFYPPAIGRGQWFRFFSNGFIHADYFHLFFNMYALYGFGRFLESSFLTLFPGYGRTLYVVLYFLALPVCLLPTYWRNRNNHYYRSLGASGAVSAVIFGSIMLIPTTRISLLFLPGIPGFIFGPLYLLISSYLDRRGGGNVNHSAHIWGALFGVAFVIVACQLSGYPVLQSFVEQVRNYRYR
ncbi:MAG: rhomboid family intramembrane serine protease [Sphingobacteriales bacterium]|nr:MAG: rhomboid family intramembrane serine protease [Sphingobacteriales bacterium]